MGMPCLSAGDAFWRAPAKPAVPGGGGGHSWSFRSDYQQVVSGAAKTVQG